MFINALSWKKFNANKKKPGDGSSKSKGLAFRTPLDNIHPLVDNNKNIQNALCHGTKSTSLAETKRNLDIVRSTGAAGWRERGAGWRGRGADEAAVCALPLPPAVCATAAVADLGAGCAGVSSIAAFA